MKRVEMLRLIADDGKIITNGEFSGTVIDVPKTEADKWHEVAEQEVTE